MKKILFVLVLFLLPLNVSAFAESSTSAILMEQNSGRVLFQKNINEKRGVASISKIMTAILAIESDKLADIVTTNEVINKAYGSNIYLSIGEEIQLIDLVYGLMLRSGNDAALTIADYLGGVDNFVVKMNEKAKELGMKNSVFNNPSGLDDEGGNVLTAYDMALLTRYANSNEIYRMITGTKTYATKTNLNNYVWKNKNKLLYSYEYTTGGKTGFTDKARRTLVTTAKKDNLELIVVTLNDGNDFQTHRNLFEYGFDNYNNYLVLDKINFTVEGVSNSSDLYIKNDFYYPLKENEISFVTSKVIMKANNKKYKNDDLVGNVEVYYKEDLIHEEPVYIKVEEVKKISFWQKIRNFFKW